MVFKRARSNEHIQQRIQEIISAASQIYDSVGYDGLSFSAISELTQFTRPTIYKYFNTKEEILLKILLADMEAWVSALVNSFKVNKLYTVREIADIWVDSLNSNLRLLDLFSMLFTFIEKNVSFEALVEFKKGFSMLQQQAIDLIAQLFPKAESTDVQNFLINQLALGLGLYPMGQMSEVQIRAIEASGMYYGNVDYKSVNKSGIYQLMYCLEQGIRYN